MQRPGRGRPALPSSSWVSAQRATGGTCWSVQRAPGANLDADPGAVPQRPRVSVLLRPPLVTWTECKEQRALGPCAGGARTPGAWRLSRTAAWLQSPLLSLSSRRPRLGKTGVFRLQVPLTVNHRRLSFSHTAHVPSPSTHRVTGGHPWGQAWALLGLSLVSLSEALHFQHWSSRTLGP